jgi:hypothetical protein
MLLLLLLLLLLLSWCGMLYTFGSTVGMYRSPDSTTTH